MLPSGGLTVRSSASVESGKSEDFEAVDSQLLNSSFCVFLLVEQHPDICWLLVAVATPDPVVLGSATSAPTVIGDSDIFSLKMETCRFHSGCEMSCQGPVIVSSVVSAVSGFFGFPSTMA